MAHNEEVFPITPNLIMTVADQRFGKKIDEATAIVIMDELNLGLIQQEAAMNANSEIIANHEPYAMDEIEEQMTWMGWIRPHTVTKD